MSSAMTEAKIIDRGRGPEIAGTRITVFDVIDYYTAGCRPQTTIRDFSANCGEVTGEETRAGWHRDRIANLFRLSSRDIQAAIDYIEQHREEVDAAYQRILERHRSYQYPPELQAKIDRSRGAARRKLDEVRRRRAEESNVAEDPRGS
jgi:uncharacterized protein (DUF433 family)